MTLKDVENIISQLENAKFSGELDANSNLFNLGIEKAIDIINSAPVVDAKLRMTKQEYHRNYYKTVTKEKRRKAKEQANSNE